MSLTRCLSCLANAAVLTVPALVPFTIRPNHAPETTPAPNGLKTPAPEQAACADHFTADEADDAFTVALSPVTFL